MQEADLWIRLACSSSTFGALGSAVDLITGADGTWSAGLCHPSNFVRHPRTQVVIERLCPVGALGCVVGHHRSRAVGGTGCPIHLIARQTRDVCAAPAGGFERA